MCHSYWNEFDGENFRISRFVVKVTYFQIQQSRYFLANVSVHIECRFWLERQEAQFGHTMVIFDQFSSEYIVLSENKWLKMTIAYSQKLMNFNRTPAFYMCGYGMLIDRTAWKQTGKCPYRPSENYFETEWSNLRELLRCRYCLLVCSREVILFPDAFAIFPFSSPTWHQCVASCRQSES